MPHVTAGSENTGPVETDSRDDLPRIDVRPWSSRAGGPHPIAWTHAEQVTKEILDFLP